MKQGLGSIPLPIWLVGISLLATATACFAPATRPVRTQPGVSTTLTGGLIDSSEEAQSCDGSNECRPEGFTWVDGNADTRYGHMLSPNIGFTGGLYLDALGARAKAQGLAGWLVARTQLSYQTEHWAAALGLDTGINVVGPRVGFEVRPWGGAFRAPAIEGHFLYSQPLQTEDHKTHEDTVKVASWESGASLRVGQAVVCYTFHRQAAGTIKLVPIEGAYKARSWHSLMLGVEFDSRWM